MKVQKSALADSNLRENDWQIWGISLYSRGRSQVLKIVRDWLDSKQKKKWIATVNPEFVMKATKDGGFKQILGETDLNVVDGIGLIWAKRLSEMKGNRLANGFKAGIEVLQGKHREKLAAGSDLIKDLSQISAKKGYKVFFLGGWENRAERTANFFKSEFLMSNDQIGYCEGEPKIKNEEVVNQINEFKPDILFVAYGMKKQEEWIKNNLKKLNVGVVMGVGRSFDYYSGDLKRAPEVWRRIGMEWLYSLLKEPKRWKRQLVLPKFAWKVLNSQG